MGTMFLHEEIERGKNELREIRETMIISLGAGAIGSNLVVELSRQGCEYLGAVDFDRVEEHNIGTQAFRIEHDLGQLKTTVLDDIIFEATNGRLDLYNMQIDSNKIHRIDSTGIWVCSFDNHPSRALVNEYALSKNIDLLQVGLAEGFSEITWAEHYVPAPQPEGLDVCEYPMTRNLIMMTVSLAAEVLVRYILTGVKANYIVHFGEYEIRTERMPYDS